MDRKVYLMAAVILAMLLFMLPGAGYADPALIGAMTNAVNRPVCVALDSQGNIHVAETVDNLVKVYSRKGALLKQFSAQRPLGVAVDAAGNIYVGSGDRHSVDIYAANYTYARSLGAGRGEVDVPNSIAVDGEGKVYVLDSGKSMVRIYDSSTGQLLSSFGGPGSITNTDGFFNKPTALAVNDATNEIFVADLRKTLVVSSGAIVDGAKIQVFDKTGVFKRSFGTYGVDVGMIGSPVSMALDGSGNVFIADLLQGAALSFNAASGTFNNIALYKTTERSAPLGIAIGKNKLAYVSLDNSHSIDVYALDGYETMDETPAALAFESRQLNVNAQAQTVTITNAGTGSLGWTAVADSDWITVSAASGTAGPNSSSSLAVGTKNENLTAGTYQGVVTITSDFGQIDKISVAFTVTPAAVIGFSNGTLSVVTQKGKTPPAAQPITIGIQNVEALPWSASSDASWLGFSPSSGTATTLSALSFNIDTIEPGTYEGHITLSAPTAIGDGNKLTVALTVTPPAIISFNTGSIAVATKKGKTPDAQPLIINVQNSDSLPWSASSDAAWLSILPASGTATTASTLSINMANITPGTYTGHITLSAPTAIGDGGKMTVTLTVTQGTRISVTSNIPEAKFTVACVSASCAPASYTGTGTAWSVDDVSLGDYTVTFDAVGGYRKPLAQTKSLIDTELAVSGNYLSFADIARRTNIIVGKGANSNNDSRIRIYRNDGAPAADIMAFGPDSRFGTTVASADIDGDGVAELIAESSASADTPSVVRVLKSDGTTLVEFTPYTTPGRVNVAAGDLNGDGRAELVVAPAVNDMNAAVKVYTYKADTREMVATGIELTALGYNQAIAVAVADTTGSAAPKLVTASLMVMSVWTIDASRGAGSWSASLLNAFNFLIRGNKVSLSAGDIDGDGRDELIVGEGAGVANASSSNAPSGVMIFKTDGAMVGNFAPVANFPYGMSVAAADLTGDGIAEVIVGSGVDQRSAGGRKSSQVMIFDASGKLLNTITPDANSQGGVNVTAGEMGL